MGTPRCRNPAGRVYAVRALAGCAAGLVKIGWTAKPEKRFREIAQDLRVRGPVAVLCVEPGSIFDEERLHQRFSSRRVNVSSQSEWFELSDDEVLSLTDPALTAIRIVVPRFRCRRRTHAHDDGLSARNTQRLYGPEALNASWHTPT